MLRVLYRPERGRGLAASPEEPAVPIFHLYVGCANSPCLFSDTRLLQLTAFILEELLIRESEKC